MTADRVAPPGQRPEDLRSEAPRHVAIIMDGNGRWAKARGLPRALGHREGVQALKRTIQAAPDLGIRCLTVFGFSTENWSRPEDEVSDLMGLVRTYVASDLTRLEKAGVRLRILGRREGLPADIADIIDKAEAKTAHNERFLLQVAFNYGGRADLVDAARRHMARLASGETTEPLTEQTFEAGLATAGSPPLDLIVRTSGEQRLSNFLLWEAAYAELVFQDILWPDYGPRALAEAVAAYGVLYLGWPSVLLIWLRGVDSPVGLHWTVLVFAVAWSADILAYLAGSTFGGPKLWPRFSPNKTWSGFIGGILAGAVAGAVMTAWVDMGALTVVWGAILGLAAALATMAGDLWESALKRRFGVKDAGNTIPGHGGLLDRVDGLMFAVVVVAAGRLMVLMLEQGA